MKVSKVGDTVTKPQQVLAVVGTATVGYIGLRIAAVAMDSRVHTAVKNAMVSIAKVARGGSVTK